MNQKIILIIAVVVVMIGAIYFATKSQSPVQNEVATTSAPVVQTQQVAPAPTAQSQKTVTQKPASETVPSDWKTYTSNLFNGSVSLPKDWLLVTPYDGSLIDPDNGIFNGDIQYGLLTSFSSPDEKDKITFTNGPLDIETGNYNCAVKFLQINNQKVKETTCNDVAVNVIPGRYNYEFVDKNLVIVVDVKTATTDKVLSLITFN